MEVQFENISNRYSIYLRNHMTNQFLFVIYIQS